MVRFHRFFACSWFATAFVLLLSASAGRSADYIWTNPAGGYWSTAANWSGGVVPGGTDNALIDTTGTDPIAGQFNGLPDGSTVTIDGYTALISYFGDSFTLSTINGNDIVLYDFQPVPEPGAILFVGAVGLGVLRSFRRRGQG